jgi:hypothetical protein
VKYRFLLPAITFASLAVFFAFHFFVSNNAYTGFWINIFGWNDICGNALFACFMGGSVGRVIQYVWTIFFGLSIVFLGVGFLCPHKALNTPEDKSSPDIDSAQNGDRIHL